MKSKQKGHPLAGVVFLLIVFYPISAAFGSAFAIADAAATFLPRLGTGLRRTWRRRGWWDWPAGPVLPGFIPDIEAATIEHSLPDNIVAGRYQD